MLQCSLKWLQDTLALDSGAIAVSDAGHLFGYSLWSVKIPLNCQGKQSPNVCQPGVIA